MGRSELVSLGVINYIQGTSLYLAKNSDSITFFYRGGGGGLGMEY